MMIYLIYICYLFTIFLIVRLITIYNFKSCKTEKKSIKSMIVLGSGGHTAEMILIVKELSERFSSKIFVIANSDFTSENKLFSFSNIIIEKIPRSREVKQSYLTSVYTTLQSIITSFKVVWKNKPDLILCNGPGTCIPICFWGFILKIFYLSSCKIVYVESICRVTSLSLTGLIIYYSGIYTNFYVHWNELKIKYPKTELKCKVY